MKAVFITILIISCWLDFFLLNSLFGQTAKKKLPRSINIITSNHIDPSISGDGNSIVYLSDYKDSRRYSLMFTYKTGTNSWASPEILQAVDKLFELNYIMGFSLSYDGSAIYFTCRKSGGIGYYDIWVSYKNGKNWTPPINLGKPLNSNTNEGAPSLSADGKYMYFMRCDNMARETAGNCKIYVAKKKGSKSWNEAVELPASINAGNEMMPRIMPDGKTLVFRSDRAGDIGFYLSRFENDSWSEPMKMDFLSTDFEVVSFPARGDIVYYSVKTSKKNLLVMSKIPDEFQGDKVMQVKGVVHNENGAPSGDAIIQVFDADEHEAIYLDHPNNKDGSFYLLLPKGKVYDFAVSAKKHTHYSDLFDLTNLDKYKTEKLKIDLEGLEKGKIITANAIVFKEYTSEIADAAKTELRRVFNLLKHNPDIKVEVGVHINEVLKDSVQSSEDLTEVIIDTLSSDNTLDLLDDSDSTIVNDSEDYTDSVKELQYTYHNDRTQKQAEAIVNFLISKGISEDRLMAKGYGNSIKSIEKKRKKKNGQVRSVEIKIL